MRYPEHSSPSSRLVAAGYVLLGAAFVVEGARLFYDIYSNGTGGKRTLLTDTGMGESVGEAGARTRGAITSSKIINVRNIDERLGIITRLIRKGSLDPKVREATLGILTRKCGVDGNRRWCVPEKDWEAEVRAIFNATRDPNSPTAIRYVRDHPDVDVFTAAGKTLFRLHGEDCDGQAIAVGARLRSVGYPVRCRIIQAKNANTWSHIYLAVGLPPMGPTTWMPLDTTVPGAAPGWEAPNAYVIAKRDYEV